VAPRRAGYTVSGSPANIAVNRTMRLALQRRVALHRPRPEAIEALKAELAESEDDESRDALQAKITALESKIRRIPYIDRSTSAIAASRTSRGRSRRR